VGQSGVSGNGSGFTSGNPSAPQGSQVGFLQNNGSFSQQLTLAAGTYTVSFSAAQRATYQSSSQTFRVLIDGVAVGTFTPTGTSYATYSTGGFTVAAGVHTIAFVGLNPNGGQNTAFLDQVVISSPPPASVVNHLTNQHRIPDHSESDWNRRGGRDRGADLGCWTVWGGRGLGQEVFVGVAAARLNESQAHAVMDRDTQENLKQVEQLYAIERGLSPLSRLSDDSALHMLRGEQEEQQRIAR
jgi:hypothetical protein